MRPLECAHGAAHGVAHGATRGAAHGVDTLAVLCEWRSDRAVTERPAVRTAPRDDRNGFAPLRVSDARPNGFAPTIAIRIAVTASIIGIVFVVVWSMSVVDLQLEVARSIGASVPSAARPPLARSLLHSPPLPLRHSPPLPPPLFKFALHSQQQPRAAAAVQHAPAVAAAQWTKGWRAHSLAHCSRPAARSYCPADVSR